ncbi:MAG: RNA-binding S4 domain-containing protein [Cyanobacteria bacterium J06626_23]
MSEPFIRLDQFMKLHQLAQTGGHAKILIQSGQVEVNGETELRRGRKLIAGDQVTFEQQTHTVTL